MNDRAPQPVNEETPAAKLEIPVVYSSSTGFSAGVLNGLIGIGGGIVIVPMLIARGATPQQAIGTSLAGVIALSTIAFTVHAWHGGIAMDLPSFGLVIALGIIGSLFGSWILTHLTVRRMMLTFAVIVFCLSIRLIMQGLGIGGLEAIWPGEANVVGYAFVGFASGMLSGVFGVGGGALVVLGLAVLFGISVQEGLPLALAVNITNSMAGVIHHARAGRVQFNIVAAMIPAAIVGIALGSALTLWMSTDALRVVFGVFFCYMGTQLVRKGLRG